MQRQQQSNAKKNIEWIEITTTWQQWKMGGSVYFDQQHLAIMAAVITTNENRGLKVPAFPMAFCCC